MAPLTVALCVAVALQPILAASVQKEDRVPKTSVGKQKTAQATALGEEVWKRTSDPEETARDTILGQGHPGSLTRVVISDDDADELHRALQMWLEYLRSLKMEQEGIYTVAGLLSDESMRRKRDVISSEDEDKLLSALRMLEQHLHWMGKQKTAQATAIGKVVWKRTSDPEETAEDMILGQVHLGRFKRDVISGDDLDQIRRVLQKWMEYLRSLETADDMIRGKGHLGWFKRDVISGDDVDQIRRVLQKWLEYLRSLRHRETATNLMVGNPASPLQETDWDDILEEKRGSLDQQQEANLAPPPTKAEDVCQDLQRLGPGPGQRVLLPFPLIQRHFLRLDENQDGFLDKTELSKFTETIEALKTCMTRAA